MGKEVLWIDVAKIPDGVSFDKFMEDFNKLGVEPSGYEFFFRKL